MERKVGELFYDGSTELKVVEASDCKGCFYNNGRCYEFSFNIHGNCSSSSRSNGTSVIFKTNKEVIMETKKMPLGFLAEAQAAAKQEMINKYAGTCCVSATGQYTVFQYKDECLVSKGNLHDKVEADFCIEFDLLYTHEQVVINSQRIY